MLLASTLCLAPRHGQLATPRAIRQIWRSDVFDEDCFEMRSLNLDQLRTLVSVVEHGSFSAAARRLNLTQPAVSLQIRELERRLGVRLIERLGKQAHPTPPGRELVEAAHRIFRECDNADAAMRRYREGWIGRVRVGTTVTAMTYALPPILRRLRLEHPGIDLLVNNMPTPDSVEKVLRNELDLALVTLPVANRQLRITPLRVEMLVAILAPGTPDVPDEVDADYAVRHALLIEHTRSAAYGLVMRWLGAAASAAQEPMPLGTVEALKSAVASSLGMAIVPEVALTRDRADFLVRPLRPPLPRTLALIEHRNKPAAPALDIVRRALLVLRDGDGVRPPPGPAAPARKLRHAARGRAAG
jgi:DNA-binding transcriptional LysR family regulator